MSESSDPQPKKRQGCWYAVLVVSVLLAIGSYYAFRVAWEAANQMHCANQCQQIGLAMMCYEQMYGSFPPAYTVDGDGRRLHSWRVLLLPFLFREELYGEIRLNEPWDSPHNREVFNKADMPQYYYYHCCAATNPTDETSFVMVVGSNTISDGPHSVRIEDIKDGASKTIMFVETKDSGIHWAEPRDLDFASMSFRVNDPNGKGVGSYHHGLARINLSHCSQRVLKDDFDPKLLKALITIDGGEDVSEFFNR